MERKEELREEESTEKILSEMYHYAEYAVTGDSEKALVREYADRLKVAIERELRDATMENAVLPAVCITKKPAGSAAAMREALEKIYTCVDDCYNYDPESKLDEVIGIADVALSAPARNCDRFNTGDPLKDSEYAYAAWQRHCDDPTISPSCKIESAFKQWLFAPAERKGE